MKNPISPTQSEAPNDQPVPAGRDRACNLIAEWQDRGFQTLGGLKLWKLRLALAPAQSAISASVAV